MPYVTYNNGNSWTWHDESENHQLTGDEVILGTGLEPPTFGEITAAFPSYTPPVPVDASAALVNQVIEDPSALAKLKQALGLP